MWVEDGSRLPNSNQMSGLVSPIFGGGFASRMRQQVEEEERKSSQPFKTRAVSIVLKKTDLVPRFYLKALWVDM